MNVRFLATLAVFGLFAINSNATENPKKGRGGNTALALTTLRTVKCPLDDASNSQVRKASASLMEECNDMKAGKAALCEAEVNKIGTFKNPCDAKGFHDVANAVAEMLK